MTFRDLTPGDRFVFLTDTARLCVKKDERHFTFHEDRGDGSGFAEYTGRVGVGDNPVTRIVMEHHSFSSAAPSGCLEYRPDHNGECLNCDEGPEAHDL